MSRGTEGTTVLILTRRPGESVKIGEDVTVMVLSIRRNEFRLGVEAPRHIPVHREEVYDRIKREAQRQQEERLTSL